MWSRGSILRTRRAVASMTVCAVVYVPLDGAIVGAAAANA
jgi:hypothetical protein